VTQGATILLVEDKDSLRTMLRLALEAQGHVVIEARDEHEALERLRDTTPAIVVSDLRLPVGDGLGVLKGAKDIDPELPVIVMTAYGGIQDAVHAMKLGAIDFLAKPVDPDHLRLLIARSLAQRRMMSDFILLKEELADRRGAPTIIGEAVAMKRATQALQRVASNDTTILLEGESGTGKELFARAAHTLSARAGGPFVAINCAAIPSTLLEAELFGFEKGAFTGATQRKPGKFELANHGTLFLDEIGELPMTLQGKILRALEDRTFDRLGGTSSVKVDIRLVAATNRQLKQAVADRQFREDLYFRLSVFPITVPPLRERPEDIPILARHFIKHHCRALGKPLLGMGPATLDALQAYPWPGNVRELQNCLERAVILADGDTIFPGHLHLTVDLSMAAPGVQGTIDLSGSLGDVSKRAAAHAERLAIQRSLRRCDGNITRAAEHLKISNDVLLDKMRSLGLSMPS
jgi:DNA-binding NtrC family response regulator